MNTRPKIAVRRSDNGDIHLHVGDGRGEPVSVPLHVNADEAIALCDDLREAAGMKPLWSKLSPEERARNEARLRGEAEPSALS
jgi:hypothetical protein